MKKLKENFKEIINKIIEFVVSLLKRYQLYKLQSNYCFNKILLTGFPVHAQLGFQEPVTPVMEGIIDFHHDLMFFLIYILGFVVWFLVVIGYSFYNRFPSTRDLNMEIYKRHINFIRVPSKQNHHLWLEIIWTVIPALILISIVLPSFALIYSMDEFLLHPRVTLKAVGNQWYWTYNYGCSLTMETPGEDPLDVYTAGPKLDEIIIKTMSSAYTNRHAMELRDLFRIELGSYFKRLFVSLCASLEENSSTLNHSMSDELMEDLIPYQDALVELAEAFNDLGFRVQFTSELLNLLIDEHFKMLISLLEKEPFKEAVLFTEDSIARNNLIEVLNQLVEYLPPDEDLKALLLLLEKECFAEAVLFTEDYIARNNLIGVLNQLGELSFIEQHNAELHFYYDYAFILLIITMLVDDHVQYARSTFTTYSDFLFFCDLYRKTTSSGGGSSREIFFALSLMDNSFDAEIFNYYLMFLKLNNTDLDNSNGDLADLVNEFDALLDIVFVDSDDYLDLKHFMEYYDFLNSWNYLGDETSEFLQSSLSEFDITPALKQIIIDLERMCTSNVDITREICVNEYRPHLDPVDVLGIFLSPKYSQQHFALKFDSYMMPTDTLTNGQLRLLEVDKRVLLPTRTGIRLLVSSYDVLHSWAVPAFGVKLDGCPGRLNQTFMYIKKEGLYYGQCSEICGVNHAFMPIVIKAITPEEFNFWLLRRIEVVNSFTEKLNIKRNNSLEVGEFSLEIQEDTDKLTPEMIIQILRLITNRGSESLYRDFSISNASHLCEDYEPIFTEQELNEFRWLKLKQLLKGGTLTLFCLGIMGWLEKKYKKSAH